MTINFTDGLATTSGSLTVYSYDPASGVATGQYTAQIVQGFGVPANSTPTAPPAVSVGQAARWDGNLWQVVEDHRGATVWNKSDGSQAVITQVGPLPDSVTTTRPTGPFVAWDDKSGAWVFSQGLRDTGMKKQAQAAFQSARQQFSDLQMMGQTFGPQQQKYMQALNAIITGKDTTSTALPTAPADPTT